jgi:serpin B
MTALLPSLMALISAPIAAWAAQAPGSAAGSASDDRAASVAGNNAFAVDLYGRLRGQNGNLFFSPESISTALAMTYAGAQGETTAEMAKTLHFTLPPVRLHPAMGALLGDLNAAHTGYQLRVANALWAQQGYSILPDFVALTQRNYGAGFNQLDFKNSADAARLIINQWVEQKTEDKINDLIPPGVLTRETKLVLTNAIYFKGDWESPFDKSLTKDEYFHVSASPPVKAPLMHREGGFNYLQGEGFQALEIPYKSGDLSMIALLPDDVGGLARLEQSMTAENLDAWLHRMTRVPKVILTLPRFKMTQQFNLGKTLAAMGMPQAFDARADFSAMNPKRDLFLSDVIHKAFVDVNEEGTEAAAATAVVIARAMAMQRPQPPVVFRADHPFVFLIRDNKSGGILFMGRIIDPVK